MTLLMRTPSPALDESPKGYLTRLAEANGYASPSVLVCLVCPSAEYVISSGWAYDNLQQLLGSQTPLPEGFGYRANGKKTREGGVLLGHPVHLRHVGLVRARICPNCIDELGYVPAKWDLKAYLACPMHGTVMQKRCQNCGWRLLYSRPGLFTCKCGADLRAYSPDAAPPQLLGICEILDAITTKSPMSILQSERLGMPVNELLAMDLDVFLRVVVGIATVIIGLRSRKWPVKEAQISDAFVEVGTALSDWPRNFQALCNRWHRSNKVLQQTYPVFQVCFSWLFIGLHKNLKGKRSQTTFMLDAALRYGLRHWDRSVIRVREEELKALDLPAPRYGTITDAAIILNHPKHTVIRWLGAGRLQAVRQGTDRERSTLIDLEAMKSVQISRYPSVEQREAAKYLGVPHAVYRELVRRSLIPRDYQSEYRRGISREDLASYLASILKRAVHVSACDDTILLSEVFNSVYSIEGKVDILIAIAKGEVPAVGRARRICELSIPLSQVRSRLGDHGQPPGLISLNCTARRFDLFYQEARAIFMHLGWCRQKTGRTHYAPVEDVEDFLRDHVLLRRVAEEVTVSPGALIKAVKDRIPSVLIRLYAGKCTKARDGKVFSLFLRRSALKQVRGVARQLLKRVAS